jgi:hypothetical protein
MAVDGAVDRRTGRSRRKKTIFTSSYTVVQFGDAPFQNIAYLIQFF